MSQHTRKRSWRDPKARQQRRSPLGAEPGALHVDPHAPEPVINLIAYGPDGLEELDIHDPGEIVPFLTRYPVTWVNVDGLGDAHLLQKLGELFRIHPLSLEDVVNVYQRPKLEHFPEYQFLVMHHVTLAPHIHLEQVSLFLGKNYVVTFQEEIGDCLDPVRERLRQRVGIIRETGADYLAYAIIDAGVDHYFPVLEAYGERLDAIETQIIADPSSTTMNDIHQVKRDLLNLRRKIWPLRDALNTLVRDPVPQVSETTRIYLRDCHDHIMRVVELLEMYRELASDLLEFHLSRISFVINEVMRVLTVIATIFIPLTFIVGLYGMNFNPEKSPWNMPELNWYWGYPFAWLLMLGTTLGLLAYFRSRGWLGKIHTGAQNKRN